MPGLCIRTGQTLEIVCGQKYPRPWASSGRSILHTLLFGTDARDHRAKHHTDGGIKPVPITKFSTHECVWEICVYCIVKYVMTPQPQFTSGGFFISLQRDRRGDSLELIIIKQAYMFIFFNLHCERNVLNSHLGKKALKKQTRRK